MIINEKLHHELVILNQNIGSIIQNHSLSDLQIENFLRILEKTRYDILADIKLFNKTVEYQYEKIKTIDSDYTTELINNVLKIYVPEVMPSYRNLKTHAHKRILLNIAEITKPFKGIFKNNVFIFVKICDNILGWDIDNKLIKPISDGLIASNVITDDNISKMFYAVKGVYSENPHTEIYVMNEKEITKFLESYT